MFCVGIHGDPPILRKGIITRGFEVQPGYFTVSVRESAPSSLPAIPLDASLLTGYARGGWNVGLEYMLGRLTLADVAVGKTVYFVKDKDEPIEYRMYESPVYSTIKVPGLPIEAAVFPASACAGLRD